MPNNLQELRSLLEVTSQEHRNALGEIVEAPFGNSASLLCDHLCFLRGGMIGQFFDQRGYKQLVTDVADRVGIDWEPLVRTTSWAGLSTESIEAAIVGHVYTDPMCTDDDTQLHIPEPIAFALKSLLMGMIMTQVAIFSSCGSVLERPLDHAFSLLSTDWRKLLATVIYVHQVVRPATKRR
jgi:hypothetical protein